MKTLAKIALLVALGFNFLGADCMYDFKSGQKYLDKALNADTSVKAQLYRYSADHFIDAKYSCSEKYGVTIDKYIEMAQKAAKTWEARK